MLDEMEAINPDFFPIPLQEPRIHSPGRKHFERVLDGFLTRDEMVFLYDGSSGVLHARNPYSTKPKTINVKYTIQEWVSRFQKLLTLHVVRLPNGDAWLTAIPAPVPCIRTYARRRPSANLSALRLLRSSLLRNHTGAPYARLGCLHC